MALCFAATVDVMAQVDVRRNAVSFSKGLECKYKDDVNGAITNFEKALKFIKTNVDRIVNNQHGVCMGCIDGDFRKYMEE